MINFRNIELEDRNWITEKLNKDNRQACEFTFGNNYIWRNIYHMEVAEIFECCVFRFQSEGNYCYSFPIGDGKKREVIELLIEEARIQGQIQIFDTILEQDKEQLEEWFPGEFVIEAERDNFDYIYETERLINLTGKKLHSKRNHIARFKENNNWTYEPITEENKMDCLAMNRIWCNKQECKWNKDMANEFCAVQESIEHFTDLGLVGGVIRVDGNIVAFSIGEKLNQDTFDVHVEKAFAEIQGAYPMINQQFVMHNCQNYKYVNREEDTGTEGLRRAKLSYYPDILLQKYLVKFK